MTLTLSEAAKKLIDELVQSGRYASATDAVDAGLAALRDQVDDEISVSELRTLIAEGEASIAEHGTLDGDEAFEARRRLRRERAAAAKANA